LLGLLGNLHLNKPLGKNVWIMIRHMGAGVGGVVEDRRKINHTLQNLIFHLSKLSYIWMLIHLSIPAAYLLIPDYFCYLVDSH